MTHSSRQRLLTTGLGVIGLLTIGSAAILALLILGAADLGPWLQYLSHPWWFVYAAEPAAVDLASSMAGGFVAIAAGLVLGWRVRLVFSRSASPAAFFLFLFLLAQSFEGLRLAGVLLAPTEPAGMALLVLSRLVYAARLFGSLCLFGVSLYSLGVLFPRIETLAGAAAALSLVYAYTVPIDLSVPLSTFLYRLGDEWGSAVISYALAVIAILNPLVSAVREREIQPVGLSVCLLLITGGRDLLAFSGSVLTAAGGVACFLSGCLLFARWTNKRQYSL